MLADVLEVCGRAGLSGTVAVVDLPVAQHVARRAGALPVADPGWGDMNAAVASGLRAAREHGATTAVVLPGDVPLLQPGDIQALVDAAGQAAQAVVVAASRDGQGTNALLLRPPDVIAPAFGAPSVERHLAAGRAAGGRTVLKTGLGLAFDVDTPADLRLLFESRPGRQTVAALADLLPRSA
jgi:2-phospho-L-lactate guanylyltransferase